MLWPFLATVALQGQASSSIVTGVDAPVPGYVGPPAWLSAISESQASRHASMTAPIAMGPASANVDSIKLADVVASADTEGRTDEVPGDARSAGRRKVDEVQGSSHVASVESELSELLAFPADVDTVGDAIGNQAEDAPRATSDHDEESELRELLAFSAAGDVGSQAEDAPTATADHDEVWREAMDESRAAREEVDKEVVSIRSLLGDGALAGRASEDASRIFRRDRNPLGPFLRQGYAILSPK